MKEASTTRKNANIRPNEDFVKKAKYFASCLLDSLTLAFALQNYLEDNNDVDVNSEDALDIDLEFQTGNVELDTNYIYICSMTSLDLAVEASTDVAALYHFFSLVFIVNRDIMWHI